MCAFCFVYVVFALIKSEILNAHYSSSQGISSDGDLENLSHFGVERAGGSERHNFGRGYNLGLDSPVYCSLIGT